MFIFGKQEGNNRVHVDAVGHRSSGLRVVQSNVDGLWVPVRMDPCLCWGWMVCKVSPPSQISQVVPSTAAPHAPGDRGAALVHVVGLSACRAALLPLLFLKGVTCRMAPTTCLCTALSSEPLQSAFLFPGFVGSPSQPLVAALGLQMRDEENPGCLGSLLMD